MANKEFTFAIITFNQEKYVIELLESIKYQIETYGKEYKNHLVVCDDASKDDTVKNISEWVGDNRELFSDVIINKNVENIGTVKNIINTFKLITTEQFKIIAGDDLFYKKSIYALNIQDEIYITPVIRFSEGVYKIKPDSSVMELLFSSKPARAYIKSLKDSSAAMSTGTLWNSKYNTEEMFNAMSEYKYIEDVVLLRFLVNKCELKVVADETPYIMYRVGNGISTRKENNTPQRIAFAKEVERLYPFKKNKVLDKLNSIKLKFKALHYKVIIPAFSKKIRKFINGWFNELSEAEEYLKSIREKSENWMNNSSFL
ncbi:Glycosyltransferase involved in cell wall bisynthesis [Lachnospiraceae bacterium G41]|nr:Glycosyltransferase involved in cell wall bisynthesis [Lachnospiraceae bacterium G41]